MLMSKMLVAMRRWAAAQGDLPDRAFSSLLSLLGDMVRVARLDCSLLLRTSGVEEAADTTAEEGEAGGTPAKAAW